MGVSLAIECPVRRRRGGVAWTDVVGVKVLVSRGARCEGVSCGVGLRDGLVVPVAGVVVASMEGCPTRHVDDSIDLLVREWERFLYPGCISSGSSS